MGSVDVDIRFRFHPILTEDRKKAHEYVRKTLRTVAHRFDEELPPSREKVLALTKLEEVMFWANAAIAREA